MEWDFELCEELWFEKECHLWPSSICQNKTKPKKKFALFE
jgi:hypothetical protein